MKAPLTLFVFLTLILSFGLSGNRPLPPEPAPPLTAGPSLPEISELLALQISGNTLPSPVYRILRLVFFIISVLFLLSVSRGAAAFAYSFLFFHEHRYFNTPVIALSLGGRGPPLCLA
jgi:hypothetical protein